MLADIDLATWTSKTSPTPPPIDASSYGFFDERTRPRDVLVAEVDAAVSGYIKLRGSTGPASRAHVLEIGGLAVAPPSQRVGAGRSLIAAALDESGRRGARKLSLRVLGHNVAARRLYEACGFVVEGVLRDEFLLEGAYVDDVLMARHLDRSAA